MAVERSCYNYNELMKRAVCLISGGLDSCVTAAEAAAAGWELNFLHACYGQRTERRERHAFLEIARHFEVSRKLEIRLDWLSRPGSSALTDPSMVLPAGDVERSGIPASYVPFRNANLMAAAVSWAEMLSAKALYLGAVEEDSSGYPDCREEFFNAMERAIALGTRPETSIRVETPLIHLRKSEIVRRGLELGAPLHLTWSCYREEEIACGQCDSCLLRLRGFEEAGARDPLPYQTKLPVT